MRLLIAVFALMLLTACSGGPVKNSEVAEGHSEYDRQLALVKNLSKEADFTVLRLSYTDSPHYRPYAPWDLKPLFEALNEKDYRKCVRLALQYLEHEPVSLVANYAAMVCHRELGDEDAGNYHRFILDGLMQSIGTSGDGKTTETAFITISNEELYSFIQLNGLRARGQSLIRADGRSFDLMEVVDPETGKELSLYFDVTIQMTKGMRSLRN